MAQQSTMAQPDGASSTFGLDKAVLAGVKRLAEGDPSLAITLTPIQRAAGVSPTVAFLALLALGEGRAPPFTAEEEKLFARLQIAYQQLTGRTSRLYKLSPMLAPQSAAVAMAAAAAVEAEAVEAEAAPAEPSGGATATPPSDEAETRARAAEAELLAMLADEARDEARASEAAQRRQRNKPKPKPSAGGVEHDGRWAGHAERGQPRGQRAGSEQTEGGLDAVSVEELTAAAGAELTEEDGEGWVAVGASGKPRRAAARPPAGEPSPAQAPQPPPAEDMAKAAAPTPAAEEKAAAAAVEEEAAETAAAAAGKPAEVPPAAPEVLRAATPSRSATATSPASTSTLDANARPFNPLQLPPVAESSSGEGRAAVAGVEASGARDPSAGEAGAGGGELIEVPGEAAPGELGTLRAQVQALRAELQDREARHAAEVKAAVAAAAASAMQQAQEKGEARLQALQLRLYISIARVNTLEEALRTLFASVAPLPHVDEPTKQGGRRSPLLGAPSGSAVAAAPEEEGCEDARHLELGQRARADTDENNVKCNHQTP